MTKCIKRVFLLICTTVFLMLTACTVNIGAIVAPDFIENDWYCEELNITCLKDTAFAVMEYKGQVYTNEYYKDLSSKIETASKEDFGKIYSALAGCVDYDGKFYLRYSEFSVFYGEELNEYYWGATSSYELLSGKVKNYRSYISVKVEMDQLFDGKYVGKIISFKKV